MTLVLNVRYDPNLVKPAVERRLCQFPLVCVEQPAYQSNRTRPAQPRQPGAGGIANTTPSTINAAVLLSMSILMNVLPPAPRQMIPEVGAICSTCPRCRRRFCPTGFPLYPTRRAARSWLASGNTRACR